MASTPSTRRLLDGVAGGSLAARLGQHGRVLAEKWIYEHTTHRLIRAQVRHGLPLPERPDRHGLRRDGARQERDGAHGLYQCMNQTVAARHLTHWFICAQVDIRGKKIPTKVAKMPFVEPNYWRVPE